MELQDGTTHLSIDHVACLARSRDFSINLHLGHIGWRFDGVAMLWSALFQTFRLTADAMKFWNFQTRRFVHQNLFDVSDNAECVTTPSKSWRSSRTSVESVESLLTVCWWPRSVGGHTNSSGTRETRETCDRLLTVRVQTACEKVSRWGAWGCIDVLNYVLCTFFEWAPHIVFYSVSSENILYLVYASCMLVTLVTVFCFFQDHCGGLELLRHHSGHGSYAKHCGRKASLERSSNVARCHVFFVEKELLGTENLSWNSNLNAIKWNCWVSGRWCKLETLLVVILYGSSGNTVTPCDSPFDGSMVLLEVVWT